MATRTFVTLTDDLDGGPATVTVQFALGKDQYEIDLNDDNVTRLHEVLAPFVAVSRKRFPANSRTTGRGPGNWGDALGKKQAREIRQWAEMNGYEVNHFGRIPAEVVTAYRTANPGS